MFELYRLGYEIYIKGLDNVLSQNSLSYVVQAIIWASTQV